MHARTKTPFPKLKMLLNLFIEEKNTKAQGNTITASANVK